MELKFDDRGLIPAIVQDAGSDQVLMLAYMNAEALAKTLESCQTWFWSRTRQALWHKGATSGNVQTVEEVRYDCDADALLVRVHPAGPACHTGQESCFYRRLPDDFTRVEEWENSEGASSSHAIFGREKGDDAAILRSRDERGNLSALEQEKEEALFSLPQLFQVIQDRRQNPTPGSYTASLLEAGLPKIAQKVGEEATEVVVAALAQEDGRLVEEVADLAYHVLVLLAARGLTPADISAELARRHK